MLNPTTMKYKRRVIHTIYHTAALIGESCTWGEHLGYQKYIINKERKRVSNALYGPRNICVRRVM